MTGVLQVTGTTCKPSGYAEYDALTGYVTHEFSKKWRDESGRLWKKTYTVINLGRPDRGIPVNPDAAMASDEWNDDEELTSYATTIANTREKRHADAMQALTSYMLEHGPSKLSDLLAVTGWAAISSLREHLHMYPDVYYLFLQKPYIYGLFGQSYEPGEGRVPVIDRMITALSTHGPLTCAALCDIIGASRARVGKVLNAQTGIFKVTGQTFGKYQGLPTMIWGLTGVHTEKAEA